MADQVTDAELAEYQADYATAHLRGRCRIERRGLNAPQQATNAGYALVLQQGEEEIPCAVAAGGRRNGMTGDPFYTPFTRGSGVANKERRLIAFPAWADIQVGDRVTLGGEGNKVNELIEPGSDTSLGLCILADVDRVPKRDTIEP